LTILVVAVLTDHLDGALARKLKCSSPSGYILDGLGDRALNVALMLIALDANLLWPIVVFVIVVREFALYCVRVSQPLWPAMLLKTRPYSLAFGGTVRGALMTSSLVAWQLIPSAIEVDREAFAASLNCVLLAVTVLTLPALNVSFSPAHASAFAEDASDTPT
jgi:phosphatidylglycerophosphate synthase